MRLVPLHWTLLLAVCTWSLSGCGSEEPAGEAKATASTQPPTTSETETPATPNESAAETSSVDAEKQYAKIEELIKQQDFVAAVDKLNTLVSTAPEFAPAYFRRGTILADLGKAQPALINFNTAIKLDPQNAGYLNTRGFFLMMQKEYRAAIGDFQKALELKPKFPEALNNLGLTYVAQGNHAEGVKYFTQAIAARDKFLSAINSRAFALMNSDQPDKALEDFNRVIEFQPDNAAPYHNRALLHVRMGNHKAAIDDLSKAIVRDRLNVRYYVSRRNVYRNMKDADKADDDEKQILWLAQLQQLTQKIVSKPDDVERRLARARFLTDSPEQELAEQDWEAAFKLDPFATHFSIARIQFKKSLWQECVASCSKALDIKPDPETPESEDALQGPPAAGQAKSLERTQEQIAVLSLRGDAQLKLGQVDAAIADFSAAKRFDATVGQAYLMRAKALQQSGKNAAANAAYRIAVSMDPTLQPEPKPVIQTSGEAPAGGAVRPIPTTLE